MEIRNRCEADMGPPADADRYEYLFAASRVRLLGTFPTFIAPVDIYDSTAYLSSQ